MFQLKFIFAEFKLFPAYSTCIIIWKLAPEEEGVAAGGRGAVCIDRILTQIQLFKS